MSPTAHARERVGATIRAERNGRSLSIESAAKSGGIGHMTWRKIEQGGSVHDQSYYAVDRAFGWQSGHTLATVTEGGELTPAPSTHDTPGQSVTKPRRRTPRDSDEDRDMSPDAYRRILEQLDSASLSELRLIHSVAEARVRERTEMLDEIKSLTNTVDWTVPSFRVELLTPATPDISDEYQHAYGEYMNAWAAMQDIARLAHECETKPTRVPELQQLQERAENAMQTLTEATKRLSAAEENASNTHNTTETETKTE